MPQFETTERTRIRRMPQRASYDAAVVEAILAEGLYCHVGFNIDAQPYVIPTIYARVEDRLYIHGSAASRMLRTIGERMPVCITVTLLDGLVLARSTFHHSMKRNTPVTPLISILCQLQLAHCPPHCPCLRPEKPLRVHALVSLRHNVVPVEHDPCVVSHDGHDHFFGNALQGHVSGCTTPQAVEHPVT